MFHLHFQTWTPGPDQVSSVMAWVAISVMVMLLLEVLQVQVHDQVRAHLLEQLDIRWQR